MEREKEGFPITSLREINTLLISQHKNVVHVREIVVGSNMDRIFIVMDFVEHDMKSLMETMRQKKQEFLPGEVKCLMIQLLSAIAHLHDNWILHRDLKTSEALFAVYQKVREDVAFLDKDRMFAPDINHMQQLVLSGALNQFMSALCPSLS